MIVGVILRLFLASRESDSSAFSDLAPRSTAILPAPAGAALLTFLLFSLGSHLVAAPQPTGRSAAAHPRVILPVDQDMQPSGDYVFLDPDFYADLHRLTQTSAASDPGWLLESSRLELPAAPTLRGAAAAVDEMRVTFDFQSFQPDAMVRLPLRRDQVTLLEGRSRLDGQPTTLAWQADGMSLLVQVPAAGKHRLTLSLAGAATRSDDHLSLDVDFPLTAFFTAEASPGIGSSPIVSSRPRSDCKSSEDSLADDRTHGRSNGSSAGRATSLVADSARLGRASGSLSFDIQRVGPFTKQPSRSIHDSACFRGWPAGRFAAFGPTKVRPIPSKWSLWNRPRMCSSALPGCGLTYRVLESCRCRGPSCKPIGSSAIGPLFRPTTP